MRILMDVDGVVADLVGAVCAELEASDFGLRTPEDFVSYEFGKVLTEGERKAITRSLAAPGFCSSIPWYPAGRMFVECLKEIGEVVAVTKPFAAGRTWAWERQQWLGPLVSQVVHTGYKECVRGDVLIEDCTDHVAAWLNENELGWAILIDRPWNRGDRVPPRALRAVSYGDAIGMLRGLFPVRAAS